MIEGINVRLRVLELDDADKIYKNFNKLELRTYLANRTPVSFEDEKDFIRSSWKSNSKGNMVLGIEIIKTKKLIGTIDCWALWKFSGSYELGIAIWEKEHRSKGYGAEAMQLLLFYAFEIMNIHRMQLLVYSFNKNGLKAYSKVGFKEVGRFRKADFIYNEYHDIVLMDMLKEEMIFPLDLNEKLNELRSIIKK